ncbi:MAG: protein-export membrane protein SecF [Spirochaeta sp. LUC14_002_19_P3]|nr:MAG: protein-export membrane protein SecF [Spirochaeta sp. LUC14_002_19_P3]
MGGIMKVLNVTRYQTPTLFVSLLLIVLFWVYTFFMEGGFNFGIDFQAGINLTAELPDTANEEAIRDALAEYNPRIQTVGTEGNRYIIRIADDETTGNFQQTISKAVGSSLTSRFGQAQIISEEYIGTSFAGSLATQTIWATLIALGLILLYVWIRFKFNYAVSAIIAIFHDVLFLLGFIGAVQLEFSTATIAAVLTIIGYSLNDTIVIFDRIRENSRILKEKGFNEVIDISVTQSLSRTLITSVTTLLAVLAILVFAVGTIRDFALSLTVGIIVGTYSSVFVASPILLVWHNRDVKRIHRKLATPEAVAGTVAVHKPKAIVPDPVKQTAEEIAEATERRRAKAMKKKKKK